MTDEKEEKWPILLVDDEEDIRDVLSVSITDMGYTVLEAETGEQAIGIFRKIDPPIVMTDIKMPGMDGIELLQKIKRENPDTEVVMITGHGDMDLAIKSLKFEATDFITKPINVEALEIALKRVQDKIVMKRQLKAYTQNLEALVREKIELQDHLSSLGLMIGSISHGIKGLLTGLDGGMYLVESGFSKENQDQIKEGWETVKLMVDRIRKMVLDILYYAKERDLRWERVDPLSFAEDLAATFAPKIENQNIEFVREFDETVGEFEIDAGYIHSALTNILENAVDACTKDAGKTYHKIVFSVRQDANHVIFAVFDNGVGMDSDTVSKLFTPFFSSKGRRGTGLGLFISHKIVRQHSGEILVKSTPGQGTLFTVKIPKTLPESVKNPAAAAK
ncbi:MAG: hybrid sensor histidine kinase/response regulator [Desulfobacterales bacterium]